MKIKLSRDAKVAHELVAEQFDRTIAESSAKSAYDQMLLTRGFVSGLCSMAQLNKMNLSQKDAADVFRALKPIFDRLSKP